MEYGAYQSISKQMPRRFDLLLLLLLPITNPFPFFPKNLEEIDMAATTNVPSLSVVYRPHPAAHLRTSIHPLLELSLAQTNSQGAYLYRLDRDPDGLELIAWSGRAAS